MNVADAKQTKLKHTINFFCLFENILWHRNHKVNQFLHTRINRGPHVCGFRPRLHFGAKSCKKCKKCKIMQEMQNNARNASIFSFYCFSFWAFGTNFKAWLNIQNLKSKSINTRKKVKVIAKLYVTFRCCWKIDLDPTPSGPSLRNSWPKGLPHFPQDTLYAPSDSNTLHANCQMLKPLNGKIMHPQIWEPAH